MAKTTFEDVCCAMVGLHQKKNADYGNAFDKSFETYDAYRKGAGLEYAVGRIGDKMQRIQNLVFGGAEIKNDESIEDTLMDMASYAVMTLAHLKSK